MAKLIDLTGQRFGRLVVIESAGLTKQKNGLWRCRCDCGNIVLSSQSNLNKGTKKYGGTKSCGCLRKNNAIKQLTTHGLSRDNLGQQSRLYGIWANMKRRCLNPKRPEFINYGGRGIGFCKEWMEYKPFYRWAITHGYKSDLTLDRKDNNKGYSPENCRWITKKEQQNNRRDNRTLTHNGVTLTMSEWAVSQGIRVGTLWERLKKGWSVERALTKRRIT